MLGRVSFHQMHTDISRSIADKNRQQDIVNNQLSTQEKLQELRTDPMAAYKGSRLSSNISRKEFFVETNRDTYQTMQLSEGYIRQSVDILQRSREIAIQAANGTLNPENRDDMATELNELIEELGNMVNAQDGEGNYLFGGARTNIPPFRLLRTVSDRSHKDLITEVEYMGSNKPNMVEISDNNLVPNRLVGSEIFWTEHTYIEGKREVLNYAVSEDSEIEINNVTVKLNRGDSVQSIVEKINNSPADITAKISNFSGRLEISGVDARQIWISDKTGQVMQDLGIINASSPPDNISSDASVFQENIFDTLINLRDSMYNSDYLEIGGQALGNIDNGMDSVFTSLAKVGAITNRLDYSYERLERWDIPEMTADLDNQIAIDMAETIVKFQELIRAQNASYQVSSQAMNTSLLNYLR